MYSKVIIITFLFGCIFSSCRKSISNEIVTPNSSLNAISATTSSICVEQNDIDLLSADSIVPTVLGSPLSGKPFSVQVMKQASINLYGNSNGISTNQIYIRFRPVNDDQLAQLADMDIDLYDYPLDRDVLQEGDYYPQAGIGENDYPWLYTVVVPTFQYPSGIPYEVLDSLYIPFSDLNLENEALRITGNSTSDVCNGSSMSVINSTNNSVSPMDVPICDPCDGGGGTSAPPGSKNPVGYIKLWDSQLGNLGLKGARIVARRWFKIERTFTDATGYYRFYKSFRNKVHLTVKFTTQQAGWQAKALKGARFWQMWFPIKKSIGKYSGTLNSIPTYTFTDDNSEKTNKHRNWWAATALNAYVDYKAINTSLGVSNPPGQMRFLLTSWSKGGGSAPMNNHRTNVGNLPSSYIDYFFAKPGIALLGQLYNYLYNSIFVRKVDITIGYKVAGLASDQIREVIYHELSHASHFSNVGQDWWNNFVYSESSEIARFGIEGEKSPYGDGTALNSSYIGLGESWAYFMGHFTTDITYGLNNSSPTYFAKVTYYNNSPVMNLSSHLNALENFDPNQKVYPFYWIPTGLYYDLIDARNEISPIVDNISGYSVSQIAGYLLPSINSVSGLKDKMISINPTQSSLLTQLFQQYAY